MELHNNAFCRAEYMHLDLHSKRLQFFARKASKNPNLSLMILKIKSFKGQLYKMKLYLEGN